VLLEVGHVVRPHGLRGDVVVQLVTTVEERLAPGSSLDCQGRGLVVQSAQVLPGKPGPKGNHWLVHFAGIDSREAAEELAGSELRAEPLAGVAGLWVHELIGCEVVDGSGERHGVVSSVEANPASDLLVLHTGALIPLRFVVSAEPGRLTVDVPEGLFEI
jgi:16S rRNA processing protein RimM